MLSFTLNAGHNQTSCTNWPFLNAVSTTQLCEIDDDTYFFVFFFLCLSIVALFGFANHKTKNDSWIILIHAFSCELNWIMTLHLVDRNLWIMLSGGRSDIVYPLVDTEFFSTFYSESVLWAINSKTQVNYMRNRCRLRESLFSRTIWYLENNMRAHDNEFTNARMDAAIAVKTAVPFTRN